MYRKWRQFVSIMSNKLINFENEIKSIIDEKVEKSINFVYFLNFYHGHFLLILIFCQLVNI